MTDSLDKGNVLESAVRALEQIILTHSPNLRENSFVIETKKIITVEGVRHEVDLYVDVSIGHGYKSVFLFECKNWVDKVDKNEIIVFSEKIRALQAQRGFFVARSFTGPARAQAELDARMELLLATEHTPGPIPLGFQFLAKEHRHFHLDLEETLLSTHDAQIVVDMNTAHALLHGQVLELKDYVRAWSEELMNKTEATFSRAEQTAGTHEFSLVDERTFDVDEFSVEGKPIRRAIAKHAFAFHLTRPAVVSHFEIATRGRVYSFAPVEFQGGHLRAQFVLANHDDGGPTSA